MNGVSLQKFADDFTAAALTNGVAETATSGPLISDRKVIEHTFRDLPFGYYLVYQTGTKEDVYKRQGISRNRTICISLCINEEAVIVHGLFY